MTKELGCPAGHRLVPRLGDYCLNIVLKIIAILDVILNLNVELFNELNVGLYAGDARALLDEVVTFLLLFDLLRLEFCDVLVD